MMLSTKYRAWILFGLGAVFVASASLILRKQMEPREPEYRNIPFREWLIKYAEGHNEAETALRNIGTNGIPVLLEMVRSTDSALKKGLLSILSKQSVFDIDSSLGLQLLAAKGFEALGATANGAIPELEKALNQASTSRGAALALVGIGSTNALQPLLRALKNDNREIRANSVLAFAQLKELPDSAVVALCNALNDKDHGVRFAAAEVLGERGHNAPVLAVPALALALHDGSPAVRYAAVRALGRLGSNAWNAIPEVRLATNDTIKLVRQEAVRALAKMVTPGSHEERE